MAQWDITADAGTNVGAGGSGNQAITEPTGFDNATINSVTVVGSPTITTDASTDDTIQIWWYFATDADGAVYGSNTSAQCFCEAELGNLVGSDTIQANAGVSPAPGTAVANDWDTLRYGVGYTVNMKGDGETCSWAAFTIRVDYTTATPSDYNAVPTILHSYKAMGVR